MTSILSLLCISVLSPKVILFSSLRKKGQTNGARFLAQAVLFWCAVSCKRQLTGSYSVFLQRDLRLLSGCGGVATDFRKRHKHGVCFGIGGMFVDLPGFDVLVLYLFHAASTASYLFDTRWLSCSKGSHKA
jgi:hypothetical protein